MDHQSPRQPQNVLKPDDHSGGLICHRCLATIRTVRTIMDSAKGRSVRVFECDDCGRLTWDD